MVHTATGRLWEDHLGHLGYQSKNIGSRTQSLPIIRIMGPILDPYLFLWHRRPQAPRPGEASQPPGPQASSPGTWAYQPPGLQAWAWRTCLFRKYKTPLLHRIFMKCSKWSSQSRPVAVCTIHQTWKYANRIQCEKPDSGISKSYLLFLCLMDGTHGHGTTLGWPFGAFRVPIKLV